VHIDLSQQTMPRDIGVTLVCPKCRTEVRGLPDAYVCTSESCRLSYAVIDAIPKFLIDDARQLDPQEWALAINGNPLSKTSS
jgi:uncharacterized protein YbaR (Trm112 family)